MAVGAIGSRHPSKPRPSAAAPTACRPLHYDKPGSFKMVHKSGGDDPGLDLVRFVDAPAALISQCEGEGGGKVGWVGRHEGFGRVGHATG